MVQVLRSNPIRTRKEWEEQRKAAKANPGHFHGEIAKREIFWFEPKLKAWIKRVDTPRKWIGFDAKSGKELDSIGLPADYEPWSKAFNDSNPPFYKWFEGGLTNACFNEVDAHVLTGHGDEVAFIFEGDRWDPSLNDEKGGPVLQIEVSRKQLLWEVVKYAEVLKSIGLKKGDRLILNMPNILEQIYFTEAAKRLGIIYTPVFGGLSAKTLSDRIQDAGAKVVVTVDGAHRNAEVVPFKETFIDRALNDYIPASAAIKKVDEVLKTLPEVNKAPEVAQSIQKAVARVLEGEITVERSDAMHGVGMALHELKGWDSSLKSKVRTAIAKALTEVQPSVQSVLVVQFTKVPELNWIPNRDKWVHELLEKAVQEIVKKAAPLGIGARSEEEILSLPVEQFMRLVNAVCQPEIVDAEFPLFIMYTSGSTGKPKGVVHVHGGYVAGLAHTMRVAFDVDPEAEKPDVMYVVADPGWITGQSYMISAALTTRTTSIVTEGSPLFPNAGRFASIIERYQVNIFKAGSTFLKTVISDPQNIADIKLYDRSSVRVATFCAEPVSPSIQKLSMELITPQYINSYWSTEHGGIVLTHFYGNEDFKLLPDAHTYPLPWIHADVWVGQEGSALSEYRVADFEEKGEIVITQPYPYLARTIWGDAENLGKPGWKGDAERFVNIYYKHWAVPGSNGSKIAWAYTQGDYACKYADGSMTLHGRSDDVINTSGHRIGTEEIEGAILKDKQINPDSPIKNVIVVGAPHVERGTVPLAFVLTDEGKKLSLEVENRLIALVKEEKGSIAIPAGFIPLSQFPETSTGKYMRRFLRKLLEQEPLGDTSTLKNPESLKKIEAAIRQWRLKMELKDKQTVLEIHATLRVEYHQVKPDANIAILTINRPPVNAINEHVLDELNTMVEHLARRDDIKVIILTGAGTKSFIAGADIKQFLEEMHTVEDVLPLPKMADIIIRNIETMQKPVIAAVNGLALGGGNEFQMAAHYRIAEAAARFGQPEINLHMIPGYGGTQRLPRLLSAHLGETEGLVQAAEIILGGRMVDAEDALQLGLIHEVASGDALSRAVEVAMYYILNPGSEKDLLSITHAERLQWNWEWMKPRPFPAFFSSHPEVKRLIAQSQSAGRELPLNAALEAMRFGYENGLQKGLEREAQLFAELVVNPKAGKYGIQAFFDRRSAPLPARYDPGLLAARENEKLLLESGELLPIGTPFFPGVTPIPKYQYAQLAERDWQTGKVRHGDPKEAEVCRIIPVVAPMANEALLYMLTSEINFNDIWAITGVPVSPFDSHDEDWHVTGSGGLALVASVGSEVEREGRIKVGDLVAIFSGQSHLLSPIAGLDPMFADQKIQGYEGPDGSHQQFMIAQGPQIFPKVPDLTLEAAGCYMLNLGTIYRALYTTLKIEAGKTFFIEGASTGTGLEALKIAIRNGLMVTGLVSTPERARYVLERGAKGVINRKDAALKDIYTLVPEDPAKWKEWEKAGEPLLALYRKQNEGRLADYVVSHAGETSFPRSFQLLNEGGILTFYGASSGYHFTFMGKPGSVSPPEVFRRAKLRPGERVLIYYGDESGNPLDSVGLECIEAARELGAKIVVCTARDVQREFVKSLGFGEAISGVFSMEELIQHEGGRFILPKTMPPLPDSRKDTEGFKEAVRWYQESVFKPFASRVGKYFGSRNNPDLIVERASQDTLALSTMLVKPYTGRVIYVEDMANRRYSFYAPQLWMRQRRIYLPTVSIFGSHLSNAYEIQAMNELVNSGFLTVDDPEVVEFHRIAEAHQEMWENRHRAANYVLNHALPQKGLKSKDDLYFAWSQMKRS